MSNTNFIMDPPEGYEIIVKMVPDRTFQISVKRLLTEHQAHALMMVLLETVQEYTIKLDREDQLTSSTCG